MNPTRRKFIKHTGLAAAGGLFFPFDSLAERPEQFKPAAAGFQLLVMATDWGFKGTREAFCAAAKNAGYDGIEVWWPAEKPAQAELLAALKKYELKAGFLCGGYQPEWKAHLTFFKNYLQSAVGSGMRPLYINCHTGRDYFTYEQNKAFIEAADHIEKESGIPVAHETHRGRMLFAAHITRGFLEKQASLKLTLDISHWCNVHESLLYDQQDTVALALDRTHHIHARIGHPEGPQVNDPRAPEWEKTVEQHFNWWDKVAERKRQKGETMTVLTEFGPPTYMPVLPYTQQPVADQWAINVEMMQLLRKRYQ